MADEGNKTNGNPEPPANGEDKPQVPPVPAAAPTPAAPGGPGGPPNPPVKQFTAKQVMERVKIYCLLIGGYLIPVLILSYFFASQAEWYAVKRLPELSACVSFELLANQEGHEWMHLWNKPTFPILQGTVDFAPEVKATDNEQARIRSQFQELLARTRHHGSALSKLFGIYTSSIVMTGVTSAVAAILLLFITASGWNQAHNYAKAIFLVAIATGGYYIAFPKIFLLDENLAANREHYLAYIALTDEVCSYAATGEGHILVNPTSAGPTGSTTQGSAKNTGAAQEPKDKVVPSTGGVQEISRQRHAEAAEFIAYMDYELAHWNSVAVGFDPSKNPDFRKVFDDWLKTK